LLQILRSRLAEAIQAAVADVTGEQIEPPQVEDTPRPEMGDLACAVALQLSKKLSCNPRQLAQQLVERLESVVVAGVSSWSIAGPGFLNVHLDRGSALLALVDGLDDVSPARREKVLIEHTSVNPNKAAHVGHLRNACMGDTLAKICAAVGHPIEVHNYIDDTGVQVADVVIGFLDLRAMSPDEVRELPEPFDFLCWDLYTEVSARLQDDEALVERRREVLLALEEGESVEAEMGRVVSERVVGRHLLTMSRMGIEYDLLVKEGDILDLDLWSEAFERVKSSPQVVYVEEGKHAGCWVLRLSATEGFEQLQEADKVLVRSNGTATYVAKDIAHHFWKYGLLERDFNYEITPGSRPKRDGTRVWRTTSGAGAAARFGHADRAISVIDVRQSYLQSIVEQAFYLIGEDAAGDSFTHFDYEMVALSPRTAKALGIPTEASAPGAESESREFIEMSGRRGYGVKADDLLDELVRRATDEVASRNEHLAPDVQAAIGAQIAVGAARYLLLRYARNTVIVFDLDEALSFEGETGPYIQYAAVRAARIFDKLSERLGGDASAALEAALRGEDSPLAVDRDAIRARLQADDGLLWSLVLALGGYEEVLHQTASSLEVSNLARYAFTLAQHFSRFYHGYPILQANDEHDRALRVLVAYAFQRRLYTLLHLLGIPLPERM
jgi:arginyl-tRNA synthetase